jgi:hypothetical protein
MTVYFSTGASRVEMPNPHVHFLVYAVSVPSVRAALSQIPSDEADVPNLGVSDRAA